MQNRYSIQQFNTKKAALDALESPGSVESEVLHPPTSPAAAPAAQRSIDIMDPAIRAELDRLVALAIQRELEQLRVPAVPHQPAKNSRVIRFPGAG
jgi:hypothetical protein